MKGKEMKNSIELEGLVCQLKEFKKADGSPFYTFSLRFYAGKDKYGNNTHSFIKCITNKDLQLKDREVIQVKGFLGGDKYKDRNGIDHEEVKIIVTGFADDESKSEQKDDIPF